MKISRRLFGLAPLAGVPVLVKSEPNDNDVFPWADGRFPGKPGNSFHQVHGQCVITVDGADVTNRCFMYDARSGVAGCYMHRDGKPYFAGKSMAVEVLRGKVEVRLQRA